MPSCSNWDILATMIQILQWIQQLKVQGHLHDREDFSDREESILAVMSEHRRHVTHKGSDDAARDLDLLAHDVATHAKLQMHGLASFGMLGKAVLSHPFGDSHVVVARCLDGSKDVGRASQRNSVVAM